MLLNNPLQDGGGTGVIPDALGINDRDGTMQADAQAIGLGAKDGRILARGQTQFLQPPLEKLPRLQAGFLGAALGFGLIGAEKNVARHLFNSQRRDTGTEIIHRGGAWQILPPLQT